MVIGIPKGLLYWKYHTFIESFLQELGAEIIISPDTNKDILDEGVKYCVDEACLPVKVFHGHVAWLKDKCDLILVPRIMTVGEGEFICPKFCGLPEMVKNSMQDLPEITEEPIYASTRKELYKWAFNLGNRLTKNRAKINSAFNQSIEVYKSSKTKAEQNDYSLKVALLGHPYNIFDGFCNMNVINKLNSLNVGIATEDEVNKESIDEKVSRLYKKPFWNFARTAYGAALTLAEEKKVDGIVYVSSFACGIDSVVLELIKDAIGDFPLLILKIDEHSGEAGIDTRVEAFTDMLERRLKNENKFSEPGEFIHCG